MWYIHCIPCSYAQIYTKRRLETRLKEHQDACKREMISCSRELYHQIHWEETTVLDHGRGQELLVKVHQDDTLRGALQPRWRAGSPWLLDCCDEEAGREESSSLIFDLQ